MAINMSTLVYLPAQDMFGRDAIFTPIASQGPTAGSYTNRGIFTTRKLDVMLEDGTIMSDQGETIFDIRTAEYPIPPQQNDLLTIPADGPSGLPAEGDFQVVDVSDNGGGERTLVLRKIVTAP